MKQALEKLIDEAELTRAEIATVLGFEDVSSVANKLAGRRRWYQEDIDKLLALLSARLGRRVTYEEGFGAPLAPEPAPVIPGDYDGMDD